MRKDTFVEPHERRALLTVAIYAQKHDNVTLQMECDAEREAIKQNDERRHRERQEGSSE